MTQVDMVSPCAGKKDGRMCPQNGTVLMKVAILNLTGLFCHSCADGLLKHGLAQDVKEKTADVSPVRAGHLVTREDGRELHGI